MLGLLELRKHVPGLLDGVSERIQVESGVFLCPDHPLTHLCCGTGEASYARPFAKKKWFSYRPRRTGSGMASRGRDHRPLADTDFLAAQPHQNLMAGVYYFRLARAAVGFCSMPPSRSCSITMW